MIGMFVTQENQVYIAKCCGINSTRRINLDPVFVDQTEVFA